MPQENKPSILVVDDEEEILHSLQGLLRMEFDVHTAQSGADARFRSCTNSRSMSC